jgi:hypothetical protein
MKKADVVEILEVFHHVGLLFNGSPGAAELPSDPSSDNISIALYHVRRGNNKSVVQIYEK